MQLTKLRITLVTTLGLLFLVACNNSNQTATDTSSTRSNQTTKSQAANSSTPTTTSKETETKTSSHGGQGGQVIESGPYHLELLTFKEANNTHIDFFLQKGDNHEPIPNAKVTAQVQLPDGSQKSLNMKYDAQGKHYVAILPNTSPGDYKIAILTDMNGEKVNGRFSFKQ